MKLEYDFKNRREIIRNAGDQSAREIREVGPAEYDAPVGRIDGELSRKRQFKIRNGEMEYVLESSMNVQDDIR